jgi:pimeloyl-ACP methyl ester carboxylesterase
MVKKLWCLALSSVAVTLAACVTIGNADKPIGTILVPAPQASGERTLVVVLPGFGSDAEKLREHGIGEAVHQGWPQADVLLTSATIAYYAERNLVSRLEADVIAPARRQGYKQIWLAGASVGGMGAVAYERAHPGELTGLILMAPWLGSGEMLEEIRKAGGVRDWNPGPVPAVVDDDNFQRELWRVVRGWSQNEALARRVWLVCGTDDRMLPTARLLAPAIPASHYLEISGGHDWDTFVVATNQIIARMRGQIAN